jgi:hypothetical protein
MQLPASYDRLKYFEVNFTVKIKGFLKNKKKNIGMRKNLRHFVFLQSFD